MADKGKNAGGKGNATTIAIPESPHTHGYVPPTIPGKPSASSNPVGQGGSSGDESGGSGNKK